MTERNAWVAHVSPRWVARLVPGMAIVTGGLCDVVTVVRAGTDTGNAAVRPRVERVRAQPSMIMPASTTST
jgi:hypothetical protein